MKKSIKSVCYFLFLILLLIISSNDVYALDLANICGESGVLKAMRILGYILWVATRIIPFIIIILGMFDYAKAVTSNDDKALDKATRALIRRAVAGVITFIAPTIVLTLLNALNFTGGIETKDSKTFGSCTVCLLDPNGCAVSKD